MSKIKGSNIERELVHLFWSNGWAACRIAGSGSMHYPSPDLIASNKNTLLVIECKACKGNYQYFEKEEIENLLKFSNIFGGEPWLGVRFDRLDWFFVKKDNLEDSGKNLVLTKNNAFKKGISFNSLIKL